MILDRVICGVDASEESLDAVRQSARLVEEDGRLLLVAVAELEVAAQAGFAASMVATELEQEAQEALDRAREAVPEAAITEARLLSGPVPGTLRAEIDREQATLLALGTHGHGRSGGILLARASTTLLHDAPCSVLIARHSPVEGAGAFPAALAAGLDGSPAGDAAAAVARSLAARFGAALHLIVAAGGKDVDVDAVRLANPEAELSERKPVDALVEASGRVDLLVVGSRGRHGLKALGSVSERVAHQARCSVLVVRAS